MRVSLHVPGHFGEFLQGRLGPDGPVALITLPCPSLGVVAQVSGGQGLALHGGPPAAQARVLLARLGLPLPGRVAFRPLAPPGLGTGVSTASLVALARLMGWQGPPDLLARACVAAEGASDPLMFAAPARRLWASREGRTLAHLPALPQFHAIGGFWGPPRRTEPRDAGFPDIADLAALWARGGDLPTLAALASESARRTLALRGPADDPSAEIARALGAAGHAIAHTGAARAFLFAPGTLPAGAGAVLRAAGFTGIRRFTGGER